MKAIVRSLYTEPVVFLAVVQGGLTAAAAAGKISAWIPLVSLAIVTPLQRRFVSPGKA
jgi:hypothetical protein